MNSQIVQNLDAEGFSYAAVADADGMRPGVIEPVRIAEKAVRDRFHRVVRISDEQREPVFREPVSGVVDRFERFRRDPDRPDLDALYGHGEGRVLVLIRDAYRALPRRVEEGVGQLAVARNGFP